MGGSLLTITTFPPKVEFSLTRDEKL